MSNTCLLMVLCECVCANLISKANFNLLDRTDLFIHLHIMFQISFQSSKGQKSYRKFLGVRSELLLSILAFPKCWTRQLFDFKKCCPEQVLAFQKETSNKY